MSLTIEDLRYSLQPENLEGTPREFRLGSRDRGRMLVVERSGELVDSHVDGLANHLSPGDLLVLNNSKRIPGVLRGRTECGGQVELRFVDLADAKSGLCKIFPTHDVREGSVINVAGSPVRVIEAGLTKYDLARVETEDLRGLLKAAGEPILGFFYDSKWSSDCLNPYYATEEGSVESPLAGLHFTEPLIDGVRAAGIGIAFVTLHSVGSWLPFLESDVEEHEMWTEYYRIEEEAAALINQARSEGHRVVACGSTSLRAIESAADDQGRVRPVEARTSLYVTPGYRFKCAGAYFTNFHQYQTSLMVLDAAFAGTELVKRAYDYGKRHKYSFYEFGDAVLYL